ncbi:MAG: hypothetical protein KA319_07935 [Ferruginibacter sp.]|nr:hypothetical protein [Ferruginibacter sp.]
MHTKKLTLSFALLSFCFLATTTFTSCNNEEKKEPPKTEVTPTPPVIIDTPKAAEPVKNDSTPPKDTLKTPKLKPVTTKPAVPPTGS